MLPIQLRRATGADHDRVFEMMRDPDSVAMAAFTTKDPHDRAAFDAHFTKVRTNPEGSLRAITLDGQVVGTIASFVREGQTEITYWVDRSLWGRGVASRALSLFLAEMPTRPLFARAASDNAGSLHVLRKAGFLVVGNETGYANARGREIDGFILKLE